MTIQPITRSVTGQASALLIALVLAVCTASNVPAQCLIKSGSFTPYGTGCNSDPRIAFAPSLAGRFDLPSCSVIFYLNYYSGPTVPPFAHSIFMFGVASTNIPVPVFGSNCALLNSANIVLVQDVSKGSSLTIPLPAGFRPVTLYAQGVAHYVAGPSSFFPLTNGLTVTLL